MANDVRPAGLQLGPLGFTGFRVQRDGRPLYAFEGKVLGPGWRPAKMAGLPRIVDGASVYEETVSFFTWRNDEEVPDDSFEIIPMGKPLNVRHVARKSGDSGLELRYSISAKEDAPFEGIALFLPQSAAAVEGECRVTMADGKSAAFPLPLPSQMGSIADLVTRLVLPAPDGGTISLDFASPARINYDRGELRLWLLWGGLKAGESAERTVTVTSSKPAHVSLDSAFLDISGWIPFAGRNDHSPGSVIGMEDWLDSPAGKHGWLRGEGDRFVFENGTAARFWGFNICNQKLAPEKAAADQWADRCAKYGVNLIRAHKFIGQGLMGIMSEQDLTRVDEVKARRFDYFHAALWKRGVYTGWSPIWRFHVKPADKARLLAYDEVLKMHESGLFKGTPYGLATIAPDIQDIYIQTTVGMLNRVNTVTGRRYAEEPAIAYVELQNEDNAFLADYARLLERCPTYKRDVSERFTASLRQQYPTQEALSAAWGNQLTSGEGIGQGATVAFPGTGLGTDLKSRRVLDTHRFLYETQSAYYRRYAEAIRKTGYKGVLIGSCWQARSWLGHLYNVLSDREIGPIDRHNYGGGAMIHRPGSGLLSAGMQAVSDRPFALSEWNSASLAGAGDAAAIIAVYGMGLQGWDLSAQFASSSPNLDTDRVGFRQVDTVLNMGQYPSLARMIYRGDVKEGDVVANRRISIPALRDGAIGFEERFSLLGGANIKEFSAVVPQTSLAAGRVTMQFVDGPVAHPVEQNVDAFIDAADRLVRSTTGQLRWSYGDRGYFTVDTSGTQAVVGFAEGKSLDLSAATIEPQSPFAIVYVTALERGKTIADSSTLLITTIARVLPQGTLVDELGTAAVVTGEGPHLIEPVKVRVTLKGKPARRVVALDHDGRRPAGARQIAVEQVAAGQRFVLDGANSRTLYYLVERDE